MMYVIKRTVKQQKTDIATTHSRNHMKDMYDYKGVDGRYYQTEKRIPSSELRYTRIQSKEELKHKADLTTTSTYIRRAEKYLDPEKPQTPLNKINETYGLQYDEKQMTTHGDSKTVFDKLCESYPMARNYLSWTDLKICIQDRKPVRTEPVKIIRPAGESRELPVDAVKPIYDNGTVLWTIHRVPIKCKCENCTGTGKIAMGNGYIGCWKCGGTGVCDSDETCPTAVKVSVKSWYKKRLIENVFDIMYELVDKNDNQMWRLQGSKTLFRTKEEAQTFLDGMTQA